MLDRIGDRGLARRASTAAFVAGLNWQRQVGPVVPNIAPSMSVHPELRARRLRDFELPSLGVATTAPSATTTTPEEWEIQWAARDSPEPSKLPSMSAVGRPCSSSLIPQKLPKNGLGKAL